MAGEKKNTCNRNSIQTRKPHIANWLVYTSQNLADHCLPEDDRAISINVIMTNLMCNTIHYHPVGWKSLEIIIGMISKYHRSSLITSERTVIILSHVICVSYLTRIYYLLANSKILSVIII